MNYARIEENAVVEYPVYEGDIRLRYHNVSFPTPFSPPEGYAAVEGVSPPDADYTKNVVEGDPVQSAGKWVQNWLVTDASAEQVVERTDNQWSAIRNQRNAKLAACDWTQLPDAPVDGVAWATYRQELRDITNQSDPFNITWPKEP